jgi:glycosyltransferase involved in cell wall biosynthesis
VVLEALASGLPVVAFNEAAASIYITNLVNGCLCEAKHGDFIRALLSLYRLYVHDLTEFRRYSQAARSSVLSAGWSSIASEFVTLAKDVVVPHSQTF